MEEFSTFIWIGIGIIWFLTRIVRRGVKKAAEPRRKSPRPAIAGPPAGGPSEPTEPNLGRFAGPRSFSGHGRTGPPPIVPR